MPPQRHFEKVAQAFEELVLPCDSWLPQAVIMGDFNGASHFKLQMMSFFFFFKIILSRCDRNPFFFPSFFFSPSDSNVIVGPIDGRERVVGVVDFGDVIYTWRIAELAVVRYIL